MDRVRGLLQLSRTAFPAPSTLYRSFERVPMSIWCEFPRESTTICDPGTYGAINAILFDRETASGPYQYRLDRHIRTLKTNGFGRYKLVSILDISARRTGLTTPKLAVECSSQHRENRESHRQQKLWQPIVPGGPLNGGRPSLDVPPAVCCVRSHIQRMVGQQIIQPALDGQDRLFDHQASVQPRCLSLRMVPQAPQTRVDRRSLQPWTNPQTAISTRLHIQQSPTFSHHRDGHHYITALMMIYDALYYILIRIQ